MHTQTQTSAESFHTIGLMNHRNIRHEVKDFIRPEEMYLISEISQSGGETESLKKGVDIRNRCAEIFGDWLHGFIVRENGSGRLIFVYTGPTPKKVSDILERHTLH